MPENSFHRSEKLKSRKSIGLLFESGRPTAFYPLKALWLERETEENYLVRAGFTVSKRNFKHAVNRNLLKRRMREAYRLNKGKLHTGPVKKTMNLEIMFIYVSGKTEKYKTIENAMIKILKTISRERQK